MVRGWFKCKHPFSAIGVQAQETEEPKDAFFSEVTYHMYCSKCGELLNLRYARLEVPVEDFLKRAD